MNGYGRDESRPYKNLTIAQRRFGQFALQGAAVHIERVGCGGNIAVMLMQHALNMLPLKTLYLCGASGWMPI
jgi:hypothetical protein